MGQLVGGNTSLEFYKQLETINNELDSINSELTSQAESISALNSRTDQIQQNISSLNSNYGENENGSYLRLPDGTQICWLSTTVTDQAINSNYGNGLYQCLRNWTFPVPFISTPTVSCGAFKWGTSGSWGSVSTSTNTVAGLRGFDIASRSAGTSCIIQAIAIGRWKS